MAQNWNRAQRFLVKIVCRKHPGWHNATVYAPRCIAESWGNQTAAGTQLQFPLAHPHL